MVRFAYLNKSEKSLWLPQLFDVMYGNMRLITPGGGTYEEEKASWLSEVSQALDKEPRKILLCFVGDDLAGFIQYYIRGDLLMVEELQLAQEYHCTLLFYSFCKYFIRQMTAGLRYIEAYTDRRNLISQNLIKKLGVEQVMEMEGTPFLHFRGMIGNVLKVFGVSKP